MPYVADAYDDTQPTGATLAQNLDEEVRVVKGALVDHRDRIVDLEDSEGTELVKGLMRLATLTEFNAASDAHPATPEQVLGHVNAALGGAQWAVSIGGLEARIGNTYLSAGVDTVVTFNVPFPSTCLGVVALRKAVASGQEGTSVLYYNETVNGFTFTHQAGPSAPYMTWIAVGT